MAQSAFAHDLLHHRQSMGTGHFPRSVAEHYRHTNGPSLALEHALNTFRVMSCGMGTSTVLQLRRWVRSVDFLCGDFRHRHWLSNGRGLRHVRSSFHHLRQDPQHKNSDLFDLFDLACDVIHAVALLLFLTSKHKDFNHESGFLKELTTELLLLLPSNWSSGCFSKYATNAFTSGPGHDFKMWICGTACAATMRDFIVP